METEMDVQGEDSAAESLLLLNTTPFHQGEKVLAYYRGRIHVAKVLEVDSRTKLFYVHGLNQKRNEWLGMDCVVKHNKENLQKAKALEKQHSLENSTKHGLHPKSPNVTGGKKRKTASSQPSVEKPKVPMDDPSGSALLPLKHSPKVLEPRVSDVGLVGASVVASDRFIPGWGLTSDANLLDPDTALDFTTHVLSPGTNARLSALPHKEFLKDFNSKAVENLVCTVEALKRAEAFEANETALKAELTRCKATIASQATDIASAAEEVVRLRNELNQVRVERGGVLRDASRAECARAEAEAETSALRAGRLELLGRVSEAEGAKMRAEDEAAALKAENAELMKKSVEAEAAKKHADERLVVAGETEKWLTQELKRLTRKDVQNSEKAALKAVEGFNWLHMDFSQLFGNQE